MQIHCCCFGDVTCNLHSEFSRMTAACQLSIEAQSTHLILVTRDLGLLQCCRLSKGSTYTVYHNRGMLIAELCPTFLSIKDHPLKVHLGSVLSATVTVKLPSPANMYGGSNNVHRLVVAVCLTFCFGAFGLALHRRPFQDPYYCPTRHTNVIYVRILL